MLSKHALWKYEPLVLAILALGAAILMENHHRIDMTQADGEAARAAAVIASCQPAAPGPRLGIISAFAAEGQSELIRYGGRDDVADACAASARSYSAVMMGAETGVP